MNLFGALRIGKTHAAEADFIDDPLYARGFLISAEDLPSPRPHWRQRRFAELNLWHDPRLLWTEAACGGARVLVLGTIVDPRSPTKLAGTLALRAARALNVSRDLFQDVLDHWAGRYLVLFSEGNSTRIVGDATCMLSAFYARNAPFVMASHGRIVAELRGLSEDPRLAAILAHAEWEKAQTRYLPGRMTPWDGVTILTANIALDVATLELQRIWPRRPLRRIDLRAATKTVSRALSGQMAWLSSQRRPLLVSITAGLDSRCTLAVSRPYKERIEYFTYHVGRATGHRHDAALAAEMAAELGLNHSLWTISAARELATQEALAANNPIAILPRIADAGRRCSQDTIHVRSNIAEIGRTFYGGRSPLPREPEALARIWRGMHDLPEAVDAFSEWADAVGFWAVEEIGRRDLFYWEHRMPCWHGPLVRETDIAFDTISFFNQRKLLEAMLALPVRIRQRGGVLPAIIERHWPELLKWPINARD